MSATSEDPDDEPAGDRWPTARQAIAHLGRVMRHKRRGGAIRVHHPTCGYGVDGWCDCVPRRYLVRVGRR